MEPMKANVNSGRGMYMLQWNLFFFCFKFVSIHYLIQKQRKNVILNNFFVVVALRISQAFWYQ